MTGHDTTVARRQPAASTAALVSRVSVRGRPTTDTERILTAEALAFVAELDSGFAGRRTDLLAARRQRAETIAAGVDPDFDPETAWIREDPTWRVAAPAAGLVDRRVEVTGPPERRMTINALNSGAKVWLADFEDATSPTWHNLITGQANLLDAVNGTLAFDVPGGKHYRIGPNPATIVVRPRGWHLVDKHVLVDGRPISGALMDFGLYLFHCAQLQLDRGSGPYFYLPKLESAAEARLWKDVLVYAEELLDLPYGTIRATVLIETIHAAFQMEEILYELRDHCAGLNAGRWDYLFSVIKAFADRGADYVLPDRSALTMDTPMMRAYAQLLVQTCHRRGAHAIGGMSAFIPNRDEAANTRAFEQVRLDKTREARDGFDGSWVAHPGLVDTCRTVFDAALGSAANQIDTATESVSISATDLLNVSGTPGTVTLAGVRANVRVALRYITSWLAGNGAVAIDGLMEDAATAEIARCQIWQWLRNATPLHDASPGGVVDHQLVNQLLADEAAAATADGATPIHVADARHVFETVALRTELPPFLTSWAYCRYLVEA